MKRTQKQKGWFSYLSSLKPALKGIKNNGTANQSNKTKYETNFDPWINSISETLKKEMRKIEGFSY
jgi:hypothetical protein